MSSLPGAPGGGRTRGVGEVGGGEKSGKTGRLGAGQALGCISGTRRDLRRPGLAPRCMCWLTLLMGRAGEGQDGAGGKTGPSGPCYLSVDYGRDVDPARREHESLGRRRNMHIGSEWKAGSSWGRKVVDVWLIGNYYFTQARPHLRFPHPPRTPLYPSVQYLSSRDNPGIVLSRAIESNFNTSQAKPPPQLTSTPSTEDDESSKLDLPRRV